MSSDVFEVIRAVKLKGLAEPLIVSSVPIVEAHIPKSILFFPLLFGEDDLLYPREVASIFGLKFLFEQHLQPFRLGEEPEILNLQQLFLLGLIRYANLPSLIELGEKLVLVEIQVCILFLSPSHADLVVKHLHHMLLEGLLLLLPLLLKIVDILELIHVDSVHLEVDHVELVLDDVLGPLLHGLCLVEAALDQQLDVLVLYIGGADFENLIGTVVHHILKLILLEPSVLGGKTTLLDDERVQLKLHGLLLYHFLLHSVLGDEAEDLDYLRLPDTVSTIHGLKVNLRIPIAVIEDNDVGCHQIQTQTTCSGRDEEDKFV